jgi:hypothetical protein
LTATCVIIFSIQVAWQSTKPCSKHLYTLSHLIIRPCAINSFPVWLQYVHCHINPRCRHTSNSLYVLLIQIRKKHWDLFHILVSLSFFKILH